MIREFFTTAIGKLIRGLDRFSLPSYYWTWNGRDTWVQGNPAEVERKYGIKRLHDISLSPLCFAGLRFRDVSRLWISASPFEDERTGAYHRGQIVPPPDNDINPEITEFVQWVFDEGFATKGMRQIISQIGNALITYGRTPQGLDWVQEETPFGKRVFPRDIIDLNPAFFLKDPEGYQKGIYLTNDGCGNASNIIQRIPDNLMLWGTAHMYFENPYGISEMSLLNQIEQYWRKNLLFWARANERNGSGSFIGLYDEKLLGKGNEDKLKKFEEELKKLTIETVTATYKGNEIKILAAEIADESLKGLHEALGQITSIVLTGSVTALQEGRVGGFSKEEATTTRRKSELEQYDASLIEEMFNCQLIPWLVDYNYLGVKSYPRMQIIEPDLIMPTTPKDQDTNRNEDEIVEQEPLSDKTESKTKLNVPPLNDEEMTRLAAVITQKQRERQKINNP